MRLAEDGQPMDPEPVVLATVGPAPAAPVVAATDSSFLVAWQAESEGSYDILGAVVPLTDPVEENLQLLVLASQPDLDEAEPTVAGNKEQFMVGWTMATGTEDSVVVVQMLDPAGAPTTEPVLVPRTNAQRAPSVALADSGAFVAWLEAGAQGEELRAALLHPGGDWISIQPASLLMGLDDGPSLASPASFSVSAGGAEFWLVWESPSAKPGIWLARIDSGTGTVLDSKSLELEGKDLVLAHGQAGFLLSWIKPDGSLVHSTLDPSGNPTDPMGHPISTPTALAGRHALSSGGDTPLAVWRESDGDDVGLYAARLEQGKNLVSLLIHSFGAPIAVQVGNLAPQVFEYDSRGRLTATWRSLGGQQIRRVDFDYYGLQAGAGRLQGLLASVIPTG